MFLPQSKDGDAAPKVSVTPPSPRTGHQKPDQLSQAGGEKATDGVKQARSRPSSPHLQLKNLLRSPGAKKRKVAAELAAAPKEKKDSSDLEEEGSASECHDDELADGMVPEIDR